MRRELGLGCLALAVYLAQLAETGRHVRGRQADIPLASVVYRGAVDPLRDKDARVTVVPDRRRDAATRVRQ